MRCRAVRRPAICPCRCSSEPRTTFSCACKLRKTAFDRRHLGFAALDETGGLDEARVQPLPFGVELHDVRLDRFFLGSVLIQLITLFFEFVASRVRIGRQHFVSDRRRGESK